MGWPTRQMTWDAKPVKNESESSSAGLPSHTPGLGDFQTQLLSALIAQTAAINRLAASNEMLVQAMVEDQGMDEAPVTTYLNGKSAL